MDFTLGYIGADRKKLQLATAMRTRCVPFLSAGATMKYCIIEVL